MLTRFRSFSQQNTWEAYEHIATALATVSFFGAGLTYTTIFRRVNHRPSSSLVFLTENWTCFLLHSAQRVAI
jgi:hypothetical protein